MKDMKNMIKALACIYGLMLHAWANDKLPKPAWGRYRLQTRDYNGSKNLPHEWSITAPAGPKNSDGDFAQHVVSRSGVWDASTHLYVIRSWAKNRD